MSKAVAIFRIALGLYYLANGLNFFFHFLELGAVQNPVANMLMGGFVQSGMFELVKVAEVAAGLSLIFNVYAALAMVMIYPIAVIISYIDIVVLGKELAGNINGSLFFVANTVLLLFYLPYYRGMFVLRAQPDPTFSTLKKR